MVGTRVAKDFGSYTDGCTAQLLTILLVYHVYQKGVGSSGAIPLLGLAPCIYYNITYVHGDHCLSGSLPFPS